MTAISAENFKLIQERSQRDPVWFITKLLAVRYLTPQQRQICRSIRDNKRTAAPSGHGIGKTFLAACIVLWFLFSLSRCKDPDDRSDLVSGRKPALA
jgi:hypothetical protein